jgi:PIN domain nuclease of toxin-antitoxin system
VRLLLDTQAALWWIGADRRLSGPARRVIHAAENDRLLSIAAAWEMAIKSSLGKLRLPLRVGAFLAEHLPRNGISLLSVSLRDIDRIEALPFHHRDPFDRLMAAQAIERDLTIVSADAMFERYGLPRIW